MCVCVYITKNTHQIHTQTHKYTQDHHIYPHKCWVQLCISNTYLNFGLAPFTNLRDITIPSLISRQTSPIVHKSQNDFVLSQEPTTDITITALISANETYILHVPLDTYNIL